MCMSYLTIITIVMVIKHMCLLSNLQGSVRDLKEPLSKKPPCGKKPGV